METGAATRSPGAPVRVLTGALLVVLASIVVYAPSLGSGITVDDFFLLVLNADLHRFGNVDEAGRPLDAEIRGYDHFFRHNFLHGLPKGDDFLYRPIPLCSLGFDYRRVMARLTPTERRQRLEDLVDSGRWEPAAEHLVVYHQTQLVSYTLVSLLLYLLLVMLLGERIALIAALIYVPMPVHTEAVCNLKGREELFAFGFALAAWIAWELVWRYREQGRSRALTGVLSVTSAVLILLAVLSKENAVTYGLAIWAWTEFFRPRPDRPALYWQASLASRLATRLPAPPARAAAFLAWNAVQYAAFLVVGALWTLARYRATGTLTTSGGEIFFRPDEGIVIRAFTMAKVFVEDYLVDALVTLRTHPDFSTRYIIGVESGAPSGASLEAWTCVILVTLWIASIAWLFRRGHRSASYWTLYFFLTMLLTANILAPIGTGGCWRHLLGPSLGYAVVLALGVDRLLAVTRDRTLTRRIVILVTSLYVLRLAFATRAIIPHWVDDLELYERALALDDRNPRCHYYLSNLVLARFHESVATREQAMKNALRSGTDLDLEGFRQADRVARPHLDRCRQLLERAIEIWNSQPDKIRAQETTLCANAHLALARHLSRREVEVAQSGAPPPMPRVFMRPGSALHADRIVALVEAALSYFEQAEDERGEGVNYVQFEEEAAILAIQAKIARGDLDGALASVHRAKNILHEPISPALAADADRLALVPSQPASFHVLEGAIFAAKATRVILDHLAARHPDAHATLQRMKDLGVDTVDLVALETFRKLTAASGGVPPAGLAAAATHYRTEREAYLAVTELKDLPRARPGLRRGWVPQYANAWYLAARWHHLRGQGRETIEVLAGAVEDFRHSKSPFLGPAEKETLVVEFSAYLARELLTAGQLEAVVRVAGETRALAGAPRHHAMIGELALEALSRLIAASPEGSEARARWTAARREVHETYVTSPALPAEMRERLKSQTTADPAVLKFSANRIPGS